MSSAAGRGSAATSAARPRIAAHSPAVKPKAEHDGQEHQQQKFHVLHEQSFRGAAPKRKPTWPNTSRVFEHVGIRANEPPDLRPVCSLFSHPTNASADRTQGPSLSTATSIVTPDARKTSSPLSCFARLLQPRLAAYLYYQRCI